MWNNFKILTDEEIFNNTFSINSLFRITSETEVTRDPKVRAIFRSKRVAIAIDESLILFENENFSDCKCVTFEANVDCLAVSSDGALVICGLSNGFIYGVHIKGVPVFSVSINSNDIDVAQSQTFVDIKEQNLEYYLSCKNGKVYKIHNIENEQLSNTVIGIGNDSSILNESLVNNVLLDVVDTKNYNVGIKSFCLSAYEGCSLLVYSGDDYVFLKNNLVERKLHLPDTLNGVKRLHSNDRVILALTENGMLFELCQYTNLMFPFHMLEGDFIIDFAVMENNDNLMELLMLVETPSRELLLKIYEFPGMNCKYSLPVSQNTWIIDQPKSSANIYHLCGFRSDLSGLFEKVEMRMVSETQPEKRLQTLITKGLLNEAEEFAVKFKLSLQPIYEAKAKQILCDIGSIDQNNIVAVQMRFDDLLAVAKLITNIEFILQLRNMEMPDRKVMKKFLQFLIKHVQFDKFPEAYDEINEQLLRLETLRLIDTYECDMHWRKFVHHNNLINYCFKFFESDISIACLILKQHASSIIPYLKNTTILKMLNTIPAQTPPFGIIQWMRHYFPLVSKAYPETLPIVTEWTISKTTSFQYSKEWPEIGLEFGNNMLEIFENVEYLFPDTRRQYDVSIARIRQVINALEELSVLKTRFNLTLTFDYYLKESTEESAFRILQRINVRNLQNLVNEFLLSIFNEKGIDLLPILIRYINYLIRNRKGIHIWQERSVACTLLIHNETEKLKCAVQILKAAPVPWSNVLDPILKFRSSSHPLAVEIIAENQRQKIKIMKIKYGCDPDAVHNENNMKFVFRMIKINDDGLIKDLKDYVESAPQIKSSAYFYCAHELARNECVDKSIKFLEGLSEIESRQCQSQITEITTKLIEDEMDNREAFDGLIELLKFVMAKDVDCHNKMTIQRLLNVQMLRNSELGVNVSLASLANSLKIEQLLEEAIGALVGVLKMNRNNFARKAWQNIDLLSKTLTLQPLYIAIKLCRKINSVKFTCALTKSFLDIDVVNASDYVDLAILLISQQYYAFSGSVCQSDTISLAYPLAYLCLIKAEQHGCDEDIRDLLNFVRIGYDAFGLDKVYKYLDGDTASDNEAIGFILDDLVDEKPSKLPHRRDSMSIFEEVSTVNRVPVVEHRSDVVIKCLSLALKIIKHDLKPNTTFYHHFSSILGAKEELTRKEFFTTLDQSIKVKLYSAPFAIIQFMLKQQQFSEKCLMGNDLIQIMYRKILKSSLHQKEPNFNKILPILRADPEPEECLHFLKKELKNGLVKINCLTLIEKYGQAMDDSIRIQSERETRLKYYYYMQLCQIDPSLKVDANFEIESPQQLFKDLKIKIVDVQLLEKISNDFQWNFQKVLIAQIITILNIQEMEFDTQIDVMGKEQIVVKVSAEKIRALCQPYIEQVIDSKLLAAKLYEFFDTINPYFYELYLCVIDILVEIRELRKEMELWSNILHFLKHKMVTKRWKRIGQLETDWWLKHQNDAGVLPKISKYRFPFLMLVTQPLNDILNEEVNVENCDQWFPLVKLHSNMTGITALADIHQEQDILCMTALKYSISEYKMGSADNNSEVWNLQPINNAFLQAILHMVSHMKDIERILLVLYIVCNHAPEGADQVEAAYECYKFATQNEKKLSQSARTNEILIKIRRKYPMLKIQHLLHLYGLHDDKLSQLVENPLELIASLYNHASVLSSDSKINLNQVAEEIARLHQLDFHVIQIDLLKSWLSFSALESNDTLEETFYNDLNSSIDNVNDEFEINNNSVERAYYVLKTWDSEQSFKFLVNHIFTSNDESSLNTGRQLQLFDCLIKLAKDDTDASFTDLVNTPQYIALKCVHYLKSFGFKFSIEKFQVYDKLKILKQIWASNANNPKALDAITYICVGYDIYQPIIWNNLLKQMVNLHMTAELTAIIDSISTKQSLVHLDGLIIAWDYLIRLPFKSILKVRSYEQDIAMSKSLFMLQSCPVKMKMNLLELAETCVRLTQIHIASVLIAFVVDEQKDNMFKLLAPHRNDTLKADIIYLEEFGIYSFVTKLAIKELKL